MIHVCFDKQRMLVEHAQLLNTWRIWSNYRLCIADVLKILPATRVRTVSGRHKRERIANSIRCHLTQRVRQKRMPVAIAPVDRKGWPIPLKLLLKRRNQISILLINRADTAKQLVMTRYAEHALTRHIPPTQHVFEKRNYIVHSLRPAKGNE